MDYRIYPPEEMIEATVDLPISKSYEARKMVIDYLAGERPVGAGEDCADLRVLQQALSDFRGVLNLGGSATALRLLTAVAASTEACEVTLDGDESLRRRPMGILVEALRQLGAGIEYCGEEGYAPLKICGRRLSGGSMPVDSTVSSQYVSALMLIAPRLEGGLCLRLEGDTVSTPYIKMTGEMMRRRGITVDFNGYDIDIQAGKYTVPDVRDVERDWSAAAFWYETVALSAGWITLPGLHADDLQGDRMAVDYFGRLGVLSDFEAEDEDSDEPIDGVQLSASPDLWGKLEVDLSDYPDMAPALAVTAATLSVRFRLSGLRNLRFKESDRVAALRSELLKLGVVAESEASGDVLSWEGTRLPVTQLPDIDPHGDHRIAMAFAPVAIFAPGMTVRHAEVVEKSYPGFWEQLSKAGFTLEETGAAD